MTNLGWVSVTIMVLAVASCSVVTTVNRQNIDAAQVERCENSGGNWKWWGGCEHPSQPTNTEAQGEQ